MTEEQLNMIEQMAGLGFPIAEIAEAIEVDPDSLATEFLTKESISRKRYRKGYLLAQVKLRQRIFTDAGHGSSPAQTLAKNIMDQCDFKMQQYE